jgi:hypothetical protein
MVVNSESFDSAALLGGEEDIMLDQSAAVSLSLSLFLFLAVKQGGKQGM